MYFRSNEEEAKHAAIKKDQELRFMYNITNVSIATNVTIPYVDVHMNVYIFSGIIGAVFLFGLLRALMFFKVAVDASMKLHNRMFQRILRAPIAFFDTNPVGNLKGKKT
ncbi:hypothetical protein KUTeg_011848 [Tegillarca granosa]|uniref:ABC transmembrane type-1 domain-containing protein n=1 Tax=Tegillarca granosa TaxID=220873 RepID=A0ABQ9EXV1_TEGGR|nr:hypothetical protein KUTeg_011848 [Tegillarca granosa]